MLFDQLIDILEKIHSKGVVHRDLKPENILVGVGEEYNKLYLIDYGLSKFFKDKKNRHIPFTDKKSFIGTTRYASIGAHLGHELSRKDDLCSLGYLLLFLINGVVP